MFLLLLSCISLTHALHWVMATSGFGDFGEETMSAESASQWLNNGVRSLSECLNLFADEDNGGFPLAASMGCSADGYNGDMLSQTTFTETVQSDTTFTVSFQFLDGLASLVDCNSFCSRRPDMLQWYILQDGAIGNYPQANWFFTYMTTDGGADTPYWTSFTNKDIFDTTQSEPATVPSFSGDTTYSFSYFDSDSLSGFDLCVDSCKARGVLDVVADTDTCGDGLEPSGVYTATDTSPYVAQDCDAVDCPASSNGVSVADGCTCDDGYSGTIVASGTSPYFSGTCTAVDCPALSNGVSVADGCTCDDGYSGAINATGTSPYFSGTCEADYSSASGPMVSLVTIFALMFHMN